MCWVPSFFGQKSNEIWSTKNEFLNRTDTSYCIKYWVFWLFRFAWLKFIDDLVQFIFRSVVSLAWNKHLAHLSAEKRCLLTSPFILPGTQIRGGNIGFSQNKLRFWPLVGNIAWFFLSLKGQLISNANLKIFIWTKKLTIFFCISALTSKNP